MSRFDLTVGDTRRNIVERVIHQELPQLLYFLRRGKLVFLEKYLIHILLLGRECYLNDRFPELRHLDVLTQALHLHVRDEERAQVEDIAFDNGGHKRLIFGLPEAFRMQQFEYHCDVLHFVRDRCSRKHGEILSIAVYFLREFDKIRCTFSFAHIFQFVYLVDDKHPEVEFFQPVHVVLVELFVRDDDIIV